MFSKSNPAKRLNLVLIVSICIGEALVMFALPSFGDLSNWVTVLLDITLLTLITIPLVNWTVTIPMKKYIHDLEFAKHKILVRENQMLAALNSLAAAKDNETGSHIIRTQQYVELLAKRLKSMGHYTKELDDQCIDTLFKAALLHDIGKVGIPDNILNKMGRLNDEEWEVMKSHASIGETVLSSAEVKSDSDQGVVQKAIQMAGGHHEKWDGTGYPRGLKGKDIPLAARIMALADVYDALVSERVYKSGWSHEDAVKEIVSKSGLHFDPLVVDALMEEQTNFQEIAQKYRDN